MRFFKAAISRRYVVVAFLSESVSALSSLRATREIPAFSAAAMFAFFNPPFPRNGNAVNQEEPEQQTGRVLAALKAVAIRESDEESVAPSQTGRPVTIVLISRTDTFTSREPLTMQKLPC